MKEITSKDNLIYRKCIQLAQKKYRDKFGEFLIEGEKLADEAISAGRAETVIVSSDYGGKDVFSQANTVFMKGSLFSRIARTETSQGIAVITAKRNYEKLPEDAGNIVVLDRLQDPGNIGTIIRTAEAAGYGGVITVKGTADVYSPKVVRAAAGSLLRMPFIQMTDAEETIAFLNDSGKKIVSTDLNADMYYYDADLTENIALVIGNEGNGISKGFIEGSHLRIKIPMKGETESLNAAVAAGILMYRSIKKG